MRTTLYAIIVVVAAIGWALAVRDVVRLVRWLRRRK